MSYEFENRISVSMHYNDPFKGSGTIDIGTIHPDGKVDLNLNFDRVSPKYIDIIIDAFEELKRLHNQKFNNK